MKTIAERLGQQYPDTNSGQTVRLELLQDMRVRGLRPALMILLAAVGLVLLIACANVANLHLARASTRSPEIAMRAALGATRRRIVRQLLTESVFQSLLGGALGLLIALWAVNLISVSLPESTPPNFRQIHIDTTVLEFAFILSVSTGLVFGIVPALQATKQDLTTALKEGGGGKASRLGGRRFQDLFVTAEIALALVLLIGATLLMRSFLKITGESPGFNPDNVLTMQIALSESRYPEDGQWIGFFHELETSLQSMPGVRHAGMSNPSFGGWQDIFMVEGRPIPRVGEENWTEIMIVNPDYFASMEISLFKGRTFTEQDRQDSLPVAIIDRRFAETYWPGEDPIGKRIKRGDDSSSTGPWLEIVGVVENVRRFGQFFDLNSRVQLYLPYRQDPPRFMNLFVKADLPPETAADAIRRQVLELDPDQPVFNVRTLENFLADRLYARQISFVMLAVFAGVSLLLAAVGIYGLVAFSVSRRTHEIGVRMAMGAEAIDVRKLMLRRGLPLILMGTAGGLVLSILLTPFMQGLLFGVGAHDPLTFVGLTLFLALVALTATFLSAGRATRITPLEALRYE
jgi:putative ABC transport system permease protein